MIKVTLVKSPIGLKPSARKTIKALGLNKINKERVLDDKNLALYGMVRRVKSFVSIEKV